MSITSETTDIFDLNKLTPEIISKSTGSTLDKAKEYLPYFQQIFPAFNLNTKLRIAAFLSQVGHESGGLKSTKENLNYSTEGLANTWPSRFAAKLQNGQYAKNSVGRYLPSTLANKIARNPVLIALSSYSNRMGNGGPETNDGWKYIGRSLIQVTGKSNYALLTLDTGIDFISKPELLEQTSFAVLSACWFWNKNNLNLYADKSDILNLTKKINGGTIGLVHRTELYNKAISALSI
jgi:putative chitinase